MKFCSICLTRYNSKDFELQCECQACKACFLKYLLYSDCQFRCFNCSQYFQINELIRACQSPEGKEQVSLKLSNVYRTTIWLSPEQDYSDYGLMNTTRTKKQLQPNQTIYYWSDQSNEPQTQAQSNWIVNVWEYIIDIIFYWENVKQCPNCSTCFQKHGVNNRIKCEYCELSFCWDCRFIYSDIGHDEYHFMHKYMYSFIILTLWILLFCNFQDTMYFYMVEQYVYFFMICILHILIPGLTYLVFQHKLESKEYTRLQNIIFTFVVITLLLMLYLQYSITLETKNIGIQCRQYIGGQCFCQPVFKCQSPCCCGIVQQTRINNLQFRREGLYQAYILGILMYLIPELFLEYRLIFWVSIILCRLVEKPVSNSLILLHYLLYPYFGLLEYCSWQTLALVTASDFVILHMERCMVERREDPDWLNLPEFL